MNLRALATIGSSGVTLPVFNRPVTTTPVTPRLRGGAPQEPSAFWEDLRKPMALSTTASQSSAARAGAATKTRARAAEIRSMRALGYGNEGASRIVRRQTRCRVVGTGLQACP